MLAQLGAVDINRWPLTSNGQSLYWAGLAGLR